MGFQTPIVVAALTAVAAVAPMAARNESSGGKVPSGIQSPAPRGQWVWPLHPEPRVARGFDPPDQPWLPGHRGVDLVGEPGAIVRSPAAGEITFAGVIAGRGVLVVSHGAMRSTFEPVSTDLPVGSIVTEEQPVGTLSASGGHCLPRTCLHWGVLRGDVYLDPLSFVGKGPIILLPLTR